MKECLSCRIFYHPSALTCDQCHHKLEEVSLSLALEHTRDKFLRHFSERGSLKNFNAHAQYVISSYFGNHSFFSFFDLNKKHMRYGPKCERFFIQPINMTCVFNLPWFFFNVIYSNYFHFYYKGFCKRCYCKHLLKRHTKDDCDYFISYFHILRDVLNGNIVHTKKIYEKNLNDDGRLKGSHPYADLYRAPCKSEIFLDVLSVGLSVFFWLYLAVFVSFPMVKVLAQILQVPDAYEWRF
jgi:hypothetical protein